MTGQADWVPAGIDVDQPSAARVYDYFLGGAHNFAVDRALAEQIAAMTPNIGETMRSNRVFLRRAVRYLVAQGVRQFLDIGSGIPTVGNVHEIALRVRARRRGGLRRHRPGRGRAQPGDPGRRRPDRGDLRGRAGRRSGCSPSRASSACSTSPEPVARAARRRAALRAGRRRAGGDRGGAAGGRRARQLPAASRTPPRTASRPRSSRPSGLSAPHRDRDRCCARGTRSRHTSRVRPGRAGPGVHTAVAAGSARPGGRAPGAGRCLRRRRQESLTAGWIRRVRRGRPASRRGGAGQIAHEGFVPLDLGDLDALLRAADRPARRGVAGRAVRSAGRPARSGPRWSRPT